MGSATDGRTAGAAAPVVVFLAAALLFSVQPMVARMLLPSLGGSAQVWTTCQLFFQACLLAGYGLAHLLARRPRAWRTLHVAVAALPALGLPICLEQAGAAPPEGAPVLWLLGLLTVAAAPAAVALAATAPAVQRWRAEGGAEPWSLYAVSNAGALAALVAYPLVVEPAAGLRAQAVGWAVGYGGFWIALALATTGGAPMAPARAPAPPPERTKTGAADAAPAPARWLILSAIPSSLLLGVTAHMANEVPSAPVLWVVPLLLYLLSFVVVFAERPPLPRGLALSAQPLLVAVLAVVLFVPLRMAGFSLHLAAFFVTALVLHGELARLKPEPGRLTAYYLWMAAGGALGGAFNALLAPALFPFVAEYPLALVLACWLRPAPPAGGRLAVDVGAPLLLLAATVGGILALPHAGDERDAVARLALLFLAGAVALWLRARPLRFALAVLAVLVGGFVAFRADGARTMARSAYGAYVVTAVPGSSRNQLLLGTTVQGADDPAAPAGSPPLYCYHPGSPPGLIMASPPAARPGGRFAVLGLGCGSLARYLRPGQTMRFFELDPLVVALARDTRWFGALAAARGTVDVVVGDGRLSLAKEPDRSFDAVVVDVFSSDALPQHLLTREALALYAQKLAPGGLLLLNTANRHVRIEALAAAAARDLGLAFRRCTPPPLTAAEEAAGLARASWAAMARSEAELAPWLAGDGRWEPADPDERLAAWTDDRASLLSALRW